MGECCNGKESSSVETQIAKTVLNPSDNKRGWGRV